MTIRVKIAMFVFFYKDKLFIALAETKRNNILFSAVFILFLTFAITKQILNNHLYVFRNSRRSG